MGSDDRNVLSSDSAGLLWPHAVIITPSIKAEESVTGKDEDKVLLRLGEMVSLRLWALCYH